MPKKKKRYSLPARDKYVNLLYSHIIKNKCFEVVETQPLRAFVCVCVFFCARGWPVTEELSESVMYFKILDVLDRSDHVP